MVTLPRLISAAAGCLAYRSGRINIPSSDHGEKRAPPGRQHLGVARAGAGPGQSGICRVLSVREQEILRWLHSQLSLREIAGQLFVSRDTIKSHTRHIYRKLGVSSREQAVTRDRDGHPS